MAARSINMRQDFTVPARSVFNFYLDHNRWKELLPINIKRIKDGERSLNGVGSVRNFPIPIFPMEETISKVIDDKQIEYTITKGLISKSHYGVMKFIDHSDGSSRLDYTITFESSIPFTTRIILFVVKFTMEDFAKKLAKKFKQNPNF